jgi:hypothetical protein
MHAKFRIHLFRDAFAGTTKSGAGTRPTSATRSGMSES